VSIEKTDIKLMASERLTDFHDGGGAMTGNEIISGELNNLFPDISRLDRVYGRVSLRKCFPAVMTDNQDMYYGSHAIITDPPDDDNVYVTMFTRGDFDDIRDEAKDRIESYVSIAGETLLRPMYDQLEGQRAIVCFQAVGNPTPPVGSTIVLYNSSTSHYQYVRITALETVRTTFSNQNNGTFSVDVVTIDISAALDDTFPGIAPTPYTTRAVTRIHSTIVADASKYYGVSKIVEAVTQGDFTLRVDTIYNQLVPTSQIESPVVDQFMGGDTFTYYPKGSVGSLTFSGNRTQDTSLIHLPDGIQPGSLQITILGYDFVDKHGLLDPVDADGGFSGTVDYASGQIQIEKASWSGYIHLTATPSCPVSESYVTTEIPITLESRSYNYTPNLNAPLPQPGNVKVDYMAQGKWYRLFDDGRGVFISHEENIGTGTIDYTSGSCVITLGALPDVGTSIIISWGVGVDVDDMSGLVTVNDVQMVRDVPDDHILPGSVSITWDDGTARQIVDDVNGNFTGDGTAIADYALGVFTISPSPIPAGGTTITIEYDRDTGAGRKTHGATDAIFSGANGEVATFTLPDTPVAELSFSCNWTLTYPVVERENGVVENSSTTYAIHDDGLGSLKRGSTTVGSIDYNTGEVSFDALFQYNKKVYTLVPHSYSGGTWTTAYTTYSREKSYEYVTTPEPSVFSCNYRVGTPTADQDIQDVVSAPEINLHLLPTLEDNNIVPNSVVFTLGGSTYYDVGNGDIYRDKSSVTGVGTFAGNLNYSSGVVRLTDNGVINDPSVTLNSMLCKNYSIGVPTFVFRMPGAPVREGSFSCRATDGAGTLYTAISQTNGNIEDAGIFGTIDNANGVVRLKYGSLVVAAGNENEPWYHDDLVDGDGNIWKPMDVIPETALYNAVYYSTLPLDAELVGIEPIRLPTDGRVPIFKSGDVCVVHHTDNVSIGNSFTDNQVISLPRTHLSIVDLYTYENALVDESFYTVDLQAGTITIIDSSSMNALTNGGTENITANHRIEDMILLSEAQINGFLTSVGPVTHDYPATGAQLSTAMIFGDLAGRVVRLFHQKVWDGIWRDTLFGDDCPAKYDTLNYPFIIKNRGSADQRWCVKFTGSTTVQVIGETFGIIGDYNIANEIAPINPATGTPYFTILNSGWGSGWVSGNNIRFDTTAANYPVWLARTTMQGPVEEPTDNFVMQIRGDAN
jgi:hypothetical protein